MIRDLAEMPQDATAYLDAHADEPLVDDKTQQAMLENFRRSFFAVWDGKGVAPPVQVVRQRFERFITNPGFGENFQAVGPDHIGDLQEQAQLESFPNCGRRAITIRNSSVRELPEQRPIFALPPDQPADGYPFDLLQASAVWVGSPLYVCHVGRDGAWLYVRAGFAAGWMRTDDVAYVDDAFVEQWQALPLAAIVKDDVALTDVDGIYRATAHIGAVFPLAGQEQDKLEILVPAANERRQAVAVHAFLPAEQAQSMPLPLAATHMAELANQLLGQPYGWGGLYELRDCSSALRDLFVPFGLYLPRNSGAQGQSGQVVRMEGLVGPEKERLLLEKGKPFLTLVHIPGHIMLYIGQHHGRAAVLHNYWGVHTQTQGRTERHVLGRCVITTLQPGLELPNLLPGADRRERVDAIILLDPLAEAGNELD